MSFTDYVIDILLIAVVFRQMRTKELTPSSVLLPIVLVGVACFNYLKPFTPRGNDLVLIGVLAAAGVTLGLLSGLATDVWRESDGPVLVRSGAAAAALWVIGMGFRFAFALWSSTRSGLADIARFSVEHAISGARVWTTALVAMAVGEVLARVAVLQLRRARPQLGRPLGRLSGPKVSVTGTPLVTGSTDPITGDGETGNSSW